MPCFHSGDGPAIADAAGMKPPGNAKSPCRACARAESGPGVLVLPTPHTPRYDIGNLPIRTELRKTISLLEDAEREALRTEYGIARSAPINSLSAKLPGRYHALRTPKYYPHAFDIWMHAADSLPTALLRLLCARFRASLLLLSVSNGTILRYHQAQDSIKVAVKQQSLKCCSDQ